MKNFIVDRCLNSFVEKNFSNHIEYNNISIDSRSIKNGDIFVGLKGVNFDGNSFAQEAVDNGANLLILDNKEIYDKLDSPKILVKNSLNALKEIGRNNLKKFEGKVICITGSSGKTTTKKLVSNVLSKKYKVFTAYKNFNNEIGVALNAANLDLDSDYAVFEIGSNNFGEIKLLAEYLKPHIAVVTNIGRSHIGNFKSIENIAKEKLSILDFTSERAYLFENCVEFLSKREFPVIIYGDNRQNDANILSIKRQNGNIDFEFSFEGKHYKFTLHHIYKHFVYNAVVAALISIQEKIDYTLINEALENFTPEEHRGNIINIDKLTIIDDTYNCSYESLIEAINNLSEISGNDKYAIIGQMAEIEGFEDEYYLNIYKLAEKTKSVHFMFYGDKFKGFDKQSNIELHFEYDKFIDRIREIDFGTILVKASRSNKFERIIDMLISNNQNRGRNAV